MQHLSPELSSNRVQQYATAGNYGAPLMQWIKLLASFVSSELSAILSQTGPTSRQTAGHNHAVHNVPNPISEHSGPMFTLNLRWVNLSTLPIIKLTKYSVCNSSNTLRLMLWKISIKSSNVSTYCSNWVLGNKPLGCSNHAQAFMWPHYKPWQKLFPLTKNKISLTNKTFQVHGKMA